MNQPNVTTASGETAADSQREILNRLGSAQGQFGAIITVVESGAECRDAVIQLAAVSKALDRAGFDIVLRNATPCHVPDDPADPMTVGELEKLFHTLA